MTVSTLRPNGTTTSTGISVTGASAHAALSDDSDSTYIEVTSGDQWIGGLTDLTLPAGAVIARVAARARTAIVSGTSSNIRTLIQWAGGASNLAGGGVLVNWTSATTVEWPNAYTETLTDTEADGLIGQVNGLSGASGTVRVYEYFADVTYVTVPVVNADSPTGTVTDTNQPTVTWTPTLDSDGGITKAAEVKVFTEAQYTDGGFDPDTSTPTVESGTFLDGFPYPSVPTSWQIDEILPDDTYRAYVRVALWVNGSYHYSDWDYTEFEVAVALPSFPTLDATANSANARIVISLSANAGDATTDYFELERSLDGGTTWEPVRQLVAGLITAGSVTVYDYEAPNGSEVRYRARALHDYSGEFAASEWVGDTATWSSTSWWLKHPNQPDLNVEVTIRSFLTVRREGRVGVLQALGATTALVVSDTRAPKAGTVTLRTDSIAAQDALDELLDANATLLLQSPDGHGGPDYVRFSNHERQRAVDAASAARVWDALDFIAVPSPPGDVVAWP